MSNIAHQIEIILRRSRFDAWAAVDGGVLYVGYGDNAGKAVAHDLREAKEYLARL
jgi:hypothetical protein